jgi:hypothetical protein
MAKSAAPFHEMSRSTMTHANSRLSYTVSVIHYSGLPIEHNPIPIDTLITPGSPLVSTKPGIP